MIGVLVTFHVQDGKSAQFESIFLDLAAKVRENEPGNIAYQLCRSRTDAYTYKVLELYRDEEALKDHFASDYVKFDGAAVLALLSGSPDVEYLDAVQ